jgi:cytochrome c oxidase subunit IV
MASKAARTAPSADHGHDGHGHDEPHVISIPVLIGTFVALMVLTGITVGATSFDLGGTGNLIVALAIAAVKAILVALIFMHLWFDQKYNVMVFFGSILFVVLFVSVTFIDVSRYQPDIRQVDEDTMTLEEKPMPADAVGVAPIEGAPTAAPVPAPQGEGLVLPPSDGPRTAPTAH